MSVHVPTASSGDITPSRSAACSVRSTSASCGGSGSARRSFAYDAMPCRARSSATGCDRRRATALAMRSVPPSVRGNGLSRVSSSAAPHLPMRCSSPRGTPSASQMSPSGSGYARSSMMSSSRRPASSASVRASIRARRRSTALAVNSGATARRSRAWSSPSKRRNIRSIARTDGRGMLGSGGFTNAGSRSAAATSR